MTQSDSVIDWIAQLKAGKPQAAQQLWQCYVDRLVRLARQKLGGTPRRAADEEDVVLSAFNGFFRGVEESRFPQLDNHDDLWQILVMLTERKAVDHRRRALAAKRGGGVVRGESVFDDGQARDGHPRGFHEVMDGEPSPEFAAQFAELFRQLLESLPDDTLRRIALAKMKGHTNAELAHELGLSVRSVERKLGLIRRSWQPEDTS